jgi:hypothetical protein
MHVVNHPGHHLELDKRFTANKSEAIRAKLENLRKPVAQRFPFYGLLIEFHRSVGEHLNDRQFGFGSRWRSRLRWSWYLSPQTHCVCGRIMKMTNSTSRTSISGTTFISEMVPRFEPPTDIPMIHLAMQ